jgi:hypothetical protein
MEWLLSSVALARDAATRSADRSGGGVIVSVSVREGVARAGSIASILAS